MAALRTAVLTGSASRQALLDKRRFEAVEKVWTAINDLAQLRSLSATMAILNYKVIAKEADTPKMQEFLSVIGATAPTDINQLKNVARDEQPFLTELAWAYFHAYRSILYMNLARYTALKNAISAQDSDPEKYFSIENLREILKAALPHQSKFIDENDPGAYYYLLEEIEDCLLAELRKILDGEEADKSSTEKARRIMDAVSDSNRRADQELSRQAAPEGIKKDYPQ